MPIDPQARLDARAAHPEARVLAVVHAETSTGVENDVAALRAVAAVRYAVAASDVEVPESVVTRVAREAALLARAMVAGAPEAVANLQREFAFASRVA
jgi:hypothetical protein